MPALLPASTPFGGSPLQHYDTLSSSAGSSSPSSPQPSGSKRGRKKTKPEKPAANEHLPPRTSCDSCRTRKLKCDGRSMAEGGCERCSREKTICHYSTRAPIGRPKGSVCPVKKRKVARESDEKPASPSVFDDLSSESPFQAAGNGYVLSPPSSLQPFAALQYAVDQQQRQRQQETSAFNGGGSHTKGYSDAGSQAYYSVPLDELHAPLYSSTYPSVTSDNQTPAVPQANGMSLETQQQPSSFAASSVSHSHLMDSPLATLEMAAFLDSLDRVEIKPADGLTANMLPKGQIRSRQNGVSYPPLQRSAAFLGQDSLDSDGMPLYSQPEPDVPPFAPSRRISYQGSQQYTNQEQVSILDEGVSYAVPSDFSWWDLGLDANLMGGAGVGSVSKETANAAVDNSQRGFTHRQESSWSSGTAHQDAASVTHANGGLHITSSREPTQSDTTASKGSCCSKKTALAKQATPPSQVLAPPVVKSCCSKSNGEELVKPVEPPASVNEKPSGPCPKTGAENCCCDPREQPESEREEQAKIGGLDSENHDLHAVSSSSSKEATVNNTHTQPRVHCVPNPSGTGCTCLCESSVCLLGVRRTLGHPLPISPSPYEDDLDASTDAEGSQLQGDRKTPIPSLHLTLSASRAISDSCACSASCPTCCGAAAGSEAGSASAPSHAAFNASLLISLALQIYARAVRILRDGFSSSASSSSGDGAIAGATTGTASGSSSVDGVVGGLEIKIGGYRPSKENARRIALLAIRLELSDLEKGMGRVYKMAVGGGEERAAAEESVVKSGRQTREGGETGSDVVKSEAGKDPGTGGALHVGPVAAGAEKPIPPARRLLAPVDGLVICKLREQLREMISRVEALERL
ncbi:hypothetical protein BCV69DRAFT_297477 [Microstroma glucosiphilum]|uniref:Zn(2)-C6 fungal-type domain-containing protein n=1 Tax=Pseudomicrostroma glucosiphilum TaxID=1684307 RepID=A0A316UAE1_9BASI|nr:hypothetical protein BCV69DRAFT_297477 [Pseudomicrostroma glucosiphilum]PWN22176.1 hypothetical protein BCV69DRAFT_297477 [Pseudomicrostroma glucosiphilum]